MRFTFFTLLFSLLTLPLMMHSCDENRGPKAPDSKRMELDTTSQYFDQQYRVYTLEGCEYIVVGVGNNRWGSHKGNCKNPIHYDIAVCETGIDTVEKHFDCYVEDCYFDKQLRQYSITTECGMQFYSNEKQQGVLKGFKSPKHK